MIKVIALWGEVPDPERYAEHLALARKVPGVTVRHGKVFGSPPGSTPDAAYYAELEFEDLESFQRGAASPEFAAAGAHAMELGIPLRIFFADVA